MASMTTKVLFPFIILLPMIFFHGRVLTRSDPWGWGSWEILYIPFMIVTLLCSWLVARWSPPSIALRTLLRYLPPYFLYGIYLGVYSSIGETDDRFLDRIVSGVVVSVIVSGVVAYYAPFYLALLAIADYYFISRHLPSKRGGS